MSLSYNRFERLILRDEVLRSKEVRGGGVSNHEQGPNGIVQEYNSSNEKHGYAGEFIELLGEELRFCN